MASAASKKRGLSAGTDPNVLPASTAGTDSQPAKKPRKKAVTAKSLGLTKEEYDSIKPAPIKKALKEIVKKLARQVDADWHDGWEEQARTKAKWFKAIKGPLQAVLDIGVDKQTALLQCNEVLKIVSDSFYDLLACPCRCDDMGDMGECFDLDMPWGVTYTVHSGDETDAWSYVWVALLRVHSNRDGVDEAVLLQCIKDAHDNMSGARVMTLPGFLYDADEERDAQGVPSGAKLAQYVNDRASEWKNLPTTKKVHRMRRAIDRRFDGTPERRTRDYHLYDSDEDSYGGYGGGYYGGGRRECVIM